jgi:phosphomannomutase
MDIAAAFHPFDVRGPYPQAVDETMAALVGQFVREYLPGKIVIASDNRPSSGSLKAALGTGQDLGELPIPVFYYAVCKLNAAGGVMVTASHLAAEQNGFKLVKAQAQPFNEGEILLLRRYLEDHAGRPPAPPPAAMADRSIIANYISEISSRFSTLSYPRKIIFDAGQTVITPVAAEILPRFNLDFQLLTAPRGLNPLTQEGYQNLGRAVQEAGAYLGILWDSDGDRVAFVDAAGNLIPQSYILGLIARHYRKAAFDIRAGLAARTTDYVITPSWAQNLKLAMADDPQIAFAGETSGHLIFREWYGIDDGIFAALKFLELVKDPLGEIAVLKKNFVEITEENYPLAGDYALVLDRIADYYRSKDCSVSVVDGVTVSTNEFHFNLRPSLTEPLLRLNLEARTEKQINQIRDEIRRQIQ